VAQSPGPIEPDDLAVSLAVRKDLGTEHDDAVVAEFLDRVGAAIDLRVDERLAARRALPGLPADQDTGPSVTLGLASIALGIPITAIVLAGTGSGAPAVLGLVVTWVGIAAVNVAHVRRR
jgi:hypothetical protein